MRRSRLFSRFSSKSARYALHGRPSEAGKRPKRSLLVEPLETRNLLAAHLVGHWTAGDLNATHASGDPIDGWNDTIDNIAATASGEPRLITDALNGFSVVRFEPADGADLFLVTADDSPMSGVGDFSVAVVFATSSRELRGDASNWYFNSGLVDTNVFGILDDWGLAINSQGRIAAGLGRPSRTQYSSLEGLNDGGAHVAIYTRSRGTISLYTDGTVDSRVDGGTAVRAARDMIFGGLKTSSGPFDGDIAEIRLYDTQLTSLEANDLTTQLLAKYFNSAPLANDDVYTVNEDERLMVNAAGGVLANDTDAELDPITAVIIDQGEHGTVNLAEDGSFVYQPDVNFAGTDVFTYAARDSRDSNPASVTIEVVEQDDPPVPIPDAYLLQADQTFIADAATGVLANDVNLGTTPLTVELASGVDHGTLSLNSDGSFVYTPDSGFAGKVTFAYLVTGGNTTTGPVLVELLVNEYPIVISEFMASNRNTLVDEDGDSSDWIELYNYGDQTVDLDGWYLTENRLDLTGWQFPSVTLEPSHFLTLFASGKDRPGTDAENSTGELHTDFQLSADGEYLALVGSDGQTVVSQFAGEFPPQLTDVSYGVATPATANVIVDGSSVSQFIVPADDTLGLTWTQTDFEPDANWSEGPAAVGFDTDTTAPDMGEYASTVLADSPVGYWRLEEAGGNVAENTGSLGAAANGTYFNGVHNDVDGLLLGSADSAASFQQSLSQKIDVPHVPGVNPESFSFEVWARVDGGTGYRSPLTSRGDSPQEGFLFYATPFNTWQMWTGTGQQVGWTILAGPAVEVGKWTHLVGTYDNATKTQRFYVDGVAVASVTNFHVEPNNADPLRIGGGSTEGDGAFFFEGALDEVAVYDHVLSSSRIQAHFGAARTGEMDTGVADFAGLIQHDVEASMLEVSASGYLRVPFDVNNVATLDTLTLNMNYDDGFVAYLNGQPVAERNSPVSLEFNSAATTSHSDENAVIAESIDLSPHLGLLNDGENVLAVHGLNSSLDDNDFLLLPELIATSVDVPRFQPRFLSTATPGSLNDDQFVELGPIVGQVQHTPVAPVAGEDLTVTAQLFELGTATASVTLNYRVMYGDEFSTLMLDDGSLGGDIAGDGIYTGVISKEAIRVAFPGGQADLPGKMLRYTITSNDVLSRSFRAPYLTNPLNSEGVPEYFGTVIQDPAITTPLPIFQWFVPDPEWHVTPSGNNKNWSAASVFFAGEFYDNVQVRVRGQTTVNWTKPKFKFEFNDDHEFQYAENETRVDEFNLLSHFVEKGAVSYMGENLAFQFLQDIGVPAPNTMHMHIRQNGDFYGLASFVEQIDSTFLERNGFDPNGQMYKAFSPSALSTLSPNPTTSHYRKVTEKDEPWDDFHEFTDGINGLIPGVDRSDYIFDHVNLPEVINDMAGNIILINHDRLTKNYYMYRDDNGNTEWSRFPWDMDQAFAKRTDSIFASVLYGDSEHPQSSNPIHQNHLYDAILDTPFTREMYLQRIRTLLDEYLPARPGGYFDQLIDEYHALIADDAALDNARWGAGDIADGVARLKDRLQFRQNQLESDPLVPDAPGEIDLRFGDLEFSPVSNNQDEEYVEIVNHGTSAVDISGWRLAGGVDLTFQPGTVLPAGGSLYASPNVVAFRARATGPSGGQGLFVQGNYDGHISNFGETIELVDSNSTVVDSVTTPAVPTDNQLYLRVSEVHFNPVGSDDTEFIELTNISNGPESVTLDLSGVTIGDGPSEPFRFTPGTSLDPGGYILVVKDQTAFAAVYPDTFVAVIAGEFSGSLSNSGEPIKVNDSSGSTIVEFSYGDSDPWPTRADGAGSSIELSDPAATPLADMGKYYHWRGSTEIGGSPGTAGIGPIDVVISEVLANTDTDPSGETRSDAIELFNAGEGAIDIGGWFLSDSDADLMKFPIPAGTTLQPGEYVVFDENDFNPTPATPGPNDFALNGDEGDDVWLLAPADENQVAWIVDAVHFGASPPNTSFLRVPSGPVDFLESSAQPTIGSGRLFLSAHTTLGCANSHPAVSDVVVSEVHYHPDDPSGAALAVDPTVTASDLEFIEIHNPTGSLVNLTDWRIRGGVDFQFSAGAAIAPGGTLVLISFDPDNEANGPRLAAFRAQYGIDGDVQLYGGYSGQLSNRGEPIRLERVGEPQIDESLTPYFVTDEVRYDDTSPWSIAADGLGSSLHRSATVYYGNAAASWLATAPDPGEFVVTASIPGDLTGNGLVDARDIDMLFDGLQSSSNNRGFDLDGNSAVNALDAQYLVRTVLGTFPGDANLDGVVDAVDFAIWDGNKFHNCHQTWHTADFNGDGVTDGADFNIWNSNKFLAGAALTAEAGNSDRTPRGPLARPAPHIDPTLADFIAAHSSAFVSGTVGGVEHRPQLDRRRPSEVIDPPLHFNRVKLSSEFIRRRTNPVVAGQHRMETIDDLFATTPRFECSFILFYESMSSVRLTSANTIGLYTSPLAPKSASVRRSCSF